MKLITLIPLMLLLVACDNDSNNHQDGANIWNDFSERIVIVQDNGNTPKPQDQYSTYDYSRDTLTVDANEVLPTIKTITDPLTCDEDGVTYEVTITSGSGEEKTYYSSNMACGDIERMVFFPVEEMDSLIPLLFNY